MLDTFIIEEIKRQEQERRRREEEDARRRPTRPLPPPDPHPAERIPAHPGADEETPERGVLIIDYSA